MTFTKNDFAKSLAREMGLAVKDASHAVDHFLIELQHQLAKGNTVTFRGVCTLKVVKRAAKVGTNPQNPKDGHYLIPPRHVVKFSVGLNFHEILNPNES